MMVFGPNAYKNKNSKSFITTKKFASLTIFILDIVSNTYNTNQIVPQSKQLIICSSHITKTYIKETKNHEQYTVIYIFNEKRERERERERERDYLPTKSTNLFFRTHLLETMRTLGRIMERSAGAIFVCFSSLFACLPLLLPTSINMQRT